VVEDSGYVIGMITDRGIAVATRGWLALDISAKDVIGAQVFA
jgi:hypothetical protein